MNVAREDTNDVTYLIRQGQQEVIEEDGSDRNRVILAAIAHSQSQKKMKTNAYFPCGSGDSGFKRSGKSSHEPDRRNGTDKSLPASMISFNPVEDMGGERERDLADETITRRVDPLREAPESRALAPGERMYRIPDTSWKPFELVP
jgi:hypothetical protein